MRSERRPVTAILQHGITYRHREDSTGTVAWFSRPVPINYTGGAGECLVHCAACNADYRIVLRAGVELALAVKHYKRHYRKVTATGLALLLLCAGSLWAVLGLPQEMLDSWSVLALMLLITGAFSLVGGSIIALWGGMCLLKGAPVYNLIHLASGTFERDIKSPLHLVSFDKLK